MGSKGVNRETTAGGRDFLLSLLSVFSFRSLIRSVAVTEGKSFIGEWAPRFGMCLILVRTVFKADAFRLQIVL